jgi:hypothetical protein
MPSIAEFNAMVKKLRSENISDLPADVQGRIRETWKRVDAYKERMAALQTSNAEIEHEASRMAGK